MRKNLWVWRAPHFVVMCRDLRSVRHAKLAPLSCSLRCGHSLSENGWYQLVVRSSAADDPDVTVTTLGVANRFMATFNVRRLVVVAKEKGRLTQKPVTPGSGNVYVDTGTESSHVNCSESLGRVCCSVEVILTNDGSGIVSTIAKYCQCRQARILHGVHGTSGV